MNISTFDPAKYDYKLLTSYIDNQDAKTIYRKDLINEELESMIYDQIKNKKFEDGIYQPFVGHIAFTIDNPYIKLLLEKYVNDICKENNILNEAERLILTECSFARYTPEYGNMPKLFPHFDTHKADGQRITLDIQLKSNIDWPVVVEGNSFLMDRRSAIIFYGTQQIHWRAKRDYFKDDDFTEMLFCHFSFDPKKEWSENQKEVLEYRSHRMRKLLDIGNLPETYDTIYKKENK